MGFMVILLLLCTFTVTVDSCKQLGMMKFGRHNENDDDFKRPAFTTAKNNMMSLKCYGGQTRWCWPGCCMGEYSNI